MEYEEAFDDLVDIYLEDSWVLDIVTTDRDVAFRLDAVLTPEHPRYSAPTVGEQYRYQRATLTVTSTKRQRLRLSSAPAAVDASGESDLGNIDEFAEADWDGESAWKVSGDWGQLVAVEPSVTLTFDCEMPV